MKGSKRLSLLLFVMVIFCVFSVQLTSAEQESEKMLPESIKEEDLPPGLAKKKELPPGLAKQQEIPAMRVEQEYQQTWCLERQGLVNVALSDKTICNCLTETHAVAFASEKNWTEAIGKSLHHALTMDKEPGIVLFVKKDAEQLHVFQLNAVIKYFKLPIVVWKIEIEPEEEKEE